MLKPGSEEQVEVQDDLENKQPEQKDEVAKEIPLDDEGNPKSEEQSKKDEEESRKKEEETHKRNQEAAQRRLDQEKQRLKRELDESRRKIAELEKKSNSSYITPNQQVVKDKHYWEKRLAEDPTDALDEFYKTKRKEELEQQMYHEEQQKMISSFNETLEESKNLALEEFPNLEDESSDEYNLFMEILNKNPNWRSSPIGPLKVAKEMKKILGNGNGGNKIISKYKQAGAIEEMQRQQRVGSQPLTGGRNSNGETKKISLSREQLEWCKDNGVSPEKYAKMIIGLGKKGEVTV